MNSVQITEQVNGPRNYVIHLNIVANGAGELAHEVIVDTAQLECDTVSIWKVDADLSGFGAMLEWGGASYPVALEIPTGVGNFTRDFSTYGGLTNPKVPNYTGDLCISTIGMLTAGETGSITLHLKKKYPPSVQA